MHKSIIIGLLVVATIGIDIQDCLYQNSYSLNFTYIDGTPDNTTWA